MDDGKETRERTVPGAPDPDRIASELAALGPADAADAIERLSDEMAVDVLRRVHPSVATDIIPELEDGKRESVFHAAPSEVTQQWSRNLSFPEDTVGRLMDAPPATFAPEESVRAAKEQVREIARQVALTYCWVVDPAQRLVGVVTMRDLVVADPEARLADVMIRDVFTLGPAMPVADAMKLVVHRHYPVYPVVDADRRLIGEVRGSAMFEEQAIEISAQPGRMVGVAEEERLLTPWMRSLRFRHPWLQLNLLTAFVAAGVVGFFQRTLDELVILAVFLPVLAGQSGNTGCQALAVTLRGMTLGELRPGTERALVGKEALLGLLNGALVGLTAGAGMFVVATLQANPDRWMLSAIVAVAMTASCIVSGIAGALIPLGLRRAGADPATASSIFLTTATDVASMGLFLGLATLLLR